MSVIVEIIAPIFGIVLVGWLAARLRALDEAATRGLSLFAFNFAIPVLLLRTVAQTEMPPQPEWRFVFAYFSGKAFGKRKLAPSISPGKSWEGVYGGCIAVLIVATLVVLFGGESLANTFPVRVQASLGWAVTYLTLILIVAASVVGDLFESQLKRRAGMKDSSNLLPGHGGVLDRIDALVPVLPKGITHAMGAIAAKTWRPEVELLDPTGAAVTTSQRTGVGDFAAASRTRSLNSSALAKNSGASQRNRTSPGMRRASGYRVTSW